VALALAGPTRRQLLFADLESLLPALSLFFVGLATTGLGIFVGILASNREERVQEQVAHSRPIDGKKGDVRLETAASMGIPVEDGQSFDALIKSVIDSAQTSQDREPAHDVSLNRARLEIIVPPVPSTSWLGGRPSLPVGVDWPASSNGPASFIAQIDVRDLPDGIWGGLGPKTGWLILFTYNHGNAVHVLYTTELGEDRELPEGLRHVGTEHLYDTSPIYDLLFGGTSKMIARWPLRIVRDDASVESAGGDGRAPDQALWIGKDEAGFDLCDPIWAPFDWPLTKALLAKGLDLLAQVENMPEWRLEKRVQEGLDLDEFAKTNASLREALETLTGEVDRLSDQYAFSPRFGAAIHGELMKLEWSGRKFLRSLSSPHVFEMYEVYARYHYATDAALLPDGVRQTFEPVWKRCAQAEVGYMGGAVRDAFVAAGVSEDAVLLEIPSSQLIGWPFGDASPFGAFISGEDLKAMRLEKAVSCTTHGYE